MRDPLRIDGILEAIGDVWKQYPDLRLGQLIVNALQLSEPCPEVFYMEDPILLRKIENMARRWTETVDPPPQSDE